jgi:hypothetical protein
MKPCNILYPSPNSTNSKSLVMFRTYAIIFNNTYIYDHNIYFHILTKIFIVNASVKTI